MTTTVPFSPSSTTMKRRASQQSSAASYHHHPHDGAAATALYQQQYDADQCHYQAAHEQPHHIIKKQARSIKRRQSHSQQHHRQQKEAAIVRKALSYVEADIQHVLSQSPFLQQSEPGSHIALFHRSEIVTGQRLGKGGFSYVLEIVDFALNPAYGALLNPEQQALRELYREQTRRAPGRFALKHLQERLLWQDGGRGFFCAASDLAVEAAYMSALDHPNILSVRGLPIHGLDSLQEGTHDSYFIILDRLQDTLDKRIQQWKSSANTRRQDFPMLGKAGFALQLAGALRYLHDKGILFRDLKPQNLGFTVDGRLQLLDFGLVREMPSFSTTPQDPNALFEMSGVGTRRYMAVEIVNTSLYNDKADVYSWAMVFWEMLSLSKPYPTYTMEDHKRLVCQGGERPRLSKSWPQALQNLLQQSWTTDTVERLSMTEVECLLRSYIQCCQLLEEDNMPAVASPPESPTCVSQHSSNYNGESLWMDHQGNHSDDYFFFDEGGKTRGGLQPQVRRGGANSHCGGDDGTVTTAATSMAGGRLKAQPSSSTLSSALSDLELEDDQAMYRMLGLYGGDEDHHRYPQRDFSATSSEDLFSVFGQSATSTVTAVSTDLSNLSSVGDSPVGTWATPPSIGRTSSI